MCLIHILGAYSITQQLNMTPFDLHILQEQLKAALFAHCVTSNKR